MRLMITFAALAGLMLAADAGKTKTSFAPLAVLDRQAQERTAGKAFVPLAPESDAIFSKIDSLEALGSGRVPNYLRAAAVLPNTVEPMSRLIKTFLYAGTIAPETKLGMALRIAQVNQSPYTAAHMQRLLKTSERGQFILTAIKSEKLATLTPAEQLALSYADGMTRDIHAPSDAGFLKVRGSYNDSQIVELSFTVCLFNYFTRFVEGLHLPVEPWVKDTLPSPPKERIEPNPARVALVTNLEMEAGQRLLEQAKSPSNPAASLGLGIANSQRAMFRVPELRTAWRNFGTIARAYDSVSREIKLQVSFAVSMANGCRYCTLHQVTGLHRLGVKPAKLLSMKKDDSSLTPREKAAVLFARKLTAEPASITQADYDALRAEFGQQGAMEVLMQTCNFAFMNRFTDGLRLPSEDEAIKIYREVYGSDFTQQ
jgi:AhpD family alkylhydroperoxidase